MPTGLYTDQQSNQFSNPSYASPSFQSPAFQSPAFPAASPAYGPPARGGSNWILSLLLIGGGILLVACVLVVAAIWYAVSSIEGWVVGLGREGIVAMVEESDIPPVEKTEVIAQVDRVVDAYKAGDIGSEDLERLLVKIDDSFLMTYLNYYGIQEYLLEDSDVPPEEQAALKLAWRRVAHGMFMGKITREDFEDCLPSADDFEDAAEESDEARNEVLRKWHVRMTKLADEAGVPADPPEVDIGDEAKKLVDELLAK
jgi:hypothetical protein